MVDLVEFDLYKPTLRVVDVHGPEPSGHVFVGSGNVATIDYGTSIALQLRAYSITDKIQVEYACKILGLKLDRNGF